MWFLLLSSRYYSILPKWRIYFFLHVTLGHTFSSECHHVLEGHMYDVWCCLTKTIPVQGYGRHRVNTGKYCSNWEEVVKAAVNRTKIPLVVDSVGEVDHCVER